MRRHSGAASLASTPDDPAATPPPAADPLRWPQQLTRDALEMISGGDPAAGTAQKMPWLGTRVVRLKAPFSDDEAPLHSVASILHVDADRHPPRLKLRLHNQQLCTLLRGDEHTATFSYVSNIPLSAVEWACYQNDDQHSKRRRSLSRDMRGPALDQDGTGPGSSAHAEAEAASVRAFAFRIQSNIVELHKQQPRYVPAILTERPPPRPAQPLHATA